MTVLEARDGDQRDYEGIARLVPESGASITGDLIELFVRVVFNISVPNTDDHLRNHAFLREKGGWSFSAVRRDPQP